MGDNSLATEDMMQAPQIQTMSMDKSASEPTLTMARGSPQQGGGPKVGGLGAATASTVSLRSLDSRPVFTRPSDSAFRDSA